MKSLKETLYFHNPWWVENEVPARLKLRYRRPLLKKVISYLSLDRVLVVKGPRRVGKTTLLYQFIDSLLNKNISPQRILYISLDDIEARASLDEIIKEFEQIIKRPLVEGEETYFFLDEVHFLDNWSLQVKKYFDKKYPIKFILSGSAATLIKKHLESLAGRTIEEVLLPFSFSEFAEYKAKDSKFIKTVSKLKNKFSYQTLIDTSELIPYHQKIKILFNEYLRKGGFPHLLEVGDEALAMRLLREDVVEKVIYRDIVDLYDVKKPYILEKLFLYLVGNAGGLLNITNVANSLGLSWEYTQKYIDYLKSAYLILTLKKYAPSVEKQIRAMKKVNLIDSGFLNAFGFFNESKAIETLVGRHLQKEELYYWRERYEVDFILKQKDTMIPVEVKYRENIEKKDLAGIIKFMEKYKAKQGIVVTKDYQGEEMYKSKLLLFVPSWLFLLLAE